MFIDSPPRTVLLTNISVYVLVRSVREIDADDRDAPGAVLIAGRLTW
jgi:hypothetical protein